MARVDNGYTYEQKIAQAHREARWAVLGLVLTVLVWLACGIGLSGVDVTVFHTPLWVVAGCIGTWLFAIAVAVFLARKIMVDVSLEEDGE